MTGKKRTTPLAPLYEVWNELDEALKSAEAVAKADDWPVPAAVREARAS